MNRRGLPALSHQILETDQLPVHLARAGTGPTILMLPGWGCEVATFGAIPSILAARFSVVALDLPGFGQTPAPAKAWGTDDYASLVVEVIGRLGLGPIVLVGHSFGGKTGVTIAAHHPQLIRKLVLVDSAGIRPARGFGYYGRVWMVKTARRALRLALLRNYEEAIMCGLYARFGSSDYNNALNPILRATFVKVVNEDVRHLLPLIHAPALLYWGSQDADTPLADGMLMERLIPDAGLVVVNGAGHFSYLHDVSHFCRVVTHFVENS